MLKGLASKIVVLLRHVRASVVAVLSLVLLVSCVGTEHFACCVGSVKPAYQHGYKMRGEG